MSLSGVSIHAPTRGATTQQYIKLSDAEFQSTPLQEGRLLEDVLAHRPRLFQSTPLQEGRPYVMGETVYLGVFQSTPLQEGRLNYPL